MYEIKLINPLRQFGQLHWTLTFTDTDGVFPALRLEKKYATSAAVDEISADVVLSIETFSERATRPAPVLDEEDNVIEQPAGNVPVLTGVIIEVHQPGGVNEQWQI